MSSEEGGSNNCHQMFFSDEEDSNFTQFLNEISGSGSERKDFLKFDFFRSKSNNDGTKGF